MTLPKKALGDGEEVVASLHPHWKALVLPLIAVPVVAGLAAFAIFSLPDGSAARLGAIAIVVIAVLLLCWTTIAPLARWRTTNFVLTNRRIVTRTGVFSRTGRDVPLHRINDVSFSHSLFERMLGAGTIVIESAGERGQLTFGDVPHVEDVQREIYRLVEEDDLRRRRWGDDADEIAYDER